MSACMNIIVNIKKISTKEGAKRINSQTKSVKKQYCPFKSTPTLEKSELLKIDHLTLKKCYHFPGIITSHLKIATTINLTKRKSCWKILLSLFESGEVLSQRWVCKLQFEVLQVDLEIRKSVEVIYFQINIYTCMYTFIILFYFFTSLVILIYGMLQKIYCLNIKSID